MTRRRGRNQPTNTNEEEQIPLPSIPEDSHARLRPAEWNDGDCDDGNDGRLNDKDCYGGSNHNDNDDDRNNVDDKSAAAKSHANGADEDAEDNDEQGLYEQDNNDDVGNEDYGINEYNINSEGNGNGGNNGTNCGKNVYFLGSAVSNLNTESSDDINEWHPPLSGNFSDQSNKSKNSNYKSKSNQRSNGKAVGNADGDTNPSQRKIDPGPFYIQTPTTQDQWELTWPIWHMLPRNERRAIAAQHGMKSIGEFEEYMTLSRAVDESEAGGGGDVGSGSGIGGGRPIWGDGASSISASTSGRAVATGVASDSASDMAALTSALEGVSLEGKSAQGDRNYEDEDDSSVSSSEDDSPATSSTKSTTSSDDTIKNPSNNNASDLDEMTDIQRHLETIQKGGLPCILPDELLHKTFSYLPVDDHASLALVSPHWSRFTRCEALYKALCMRVYLRQSKRKALHPGRFKPQPNNHNNPSNNQPIYCCSCPYRNMLALRPRVRTSNGVYILKYSEIRKIQRDMWTEVPVGAILESVYYRYLYFLEDGRCIYALTHHSPLEIIPRFKKLLLAGGSGSSVGGGSHHHGVYHGTNKSHGSKPPPQQESQDKHAIWGTFQLKKDTLKIWVSHPWHHVEFQLRVIPSNKVLNYDNGDRGMYTTLALEKHVSSASGNFDEDVNDGYGGHGGGDLVKYEVPDQNYFRFFRDRRL